MKTTSLFKAVALVAIMIASVLNSEVKAQDGFITNQVMNGELVASKTIFKQDGSYLRNHMQYTFTYDDQNRLVSKQASKWDGVIDAWVPYFKMTYQYSDNEITMNYARWNESHKAYDEAVQKSVYELNDENMPTAYKAYKQDNRNKSDWTLVDHKQMDFTTNLLAIAR